MLSAKKQRRMLRVRLGQHTIGEGDIESLFISDVVYPNENRSKGSRD